MLRRVDDVLDAVEEQRARPADVQEALHAQKVARRVPGAASSARFRTRSSRAARRRRARTRGCRLVRVRAGPRRTRHGRAGHVPRRRRAGAARLPERRLDDRRRRVQACRSRAPARRGRRGPSSSRRAGRRRPPASATRGVGSPFSASTVVTTPSSSKWCLTTGSESERVQDRHGVGKARRLDDDAAKARDLASRRAAEQVAQLVREVAAQRAADAAAGKQHRALVDPPQQMVVDADVAELVRRSRPSRRSPGARADERSASSCPCRGSR